MRWANSRAVAILVALILAYQGWQFAVDTVRALRRPAATSETRETYLTRSLPTYSAYRFLNERKGRDYTLYGFHEEKMVYFADGRFIGNVFGPGRYESLHLDAFFDGESSGARRTLYHELKSLGVDHFLVPTELMKADLADDEILSGNFKLIHARARFLLFELSQASWRAGAGPNLLHNPSFEGSNGEKPEGWGGSGRVLREVTGKSHDGTASVKCEAGQSILQAAPVEAGAIYRLSFHAHGPAPGQKIYTRIVWAGRRGEVLSSDDLWPTSKPAWGRIGMIVTAPPEATMATIAITPEGQGPIWLDNVSFHELTSAEESRGDQ